MSSEKEIAQKQEPFCPHCGKPQDKEVNSNMFESKRNSKNETEQIQPPIDIDTRQRMQKELKHNFMQNNNTNKNEKAPNPLAKIFGGMNKQVKEENKEDAEAEGPK